MQLKQLVKWLELRHTSMNRLKLLQLIHSRSISLFEITLATPVLRKQQYVFEVFTSQAMVIIFVLISVDFRANVFDLAILELH